MPHTPSHSVANLAHFAFCAYTNTGAPRTRPARRLESGKKLLVYNETPTAGHGLRPAVRALGQACEAEYVFAPFLRFAFRIKALISESEIAFILTR